MVEELRICSGEFRCRLVHDQPFAEKALEEGLRYISAENDKCVIHRQSADQFHQGRKDRGEHTNGQVRWRLAVSFSEEVFSANIHFRAWSLTFSGSWSTGM